jgi:phospholipase A1/A2
VNRTKSLFLVALCALATGARAQQGAPETTKASAVTEASEAWRQCTLLTNDPAARLACFDNLPHPKESVTPAAKASAQEPATAAPQPDCRSGNHSELSRLWELEAGSDCGRFSIRGYRPISLSLVTSDSVNTAPSSPTDGHTADYQPYLTSEGRILLSVRTKIGQGFLPDSVSGGHDSLWFAYTQQSYWQIFTSSISRPFRNTDHEPEIIYIVPTPADLPGGWRLRYSGFSLTHQSNGQSLPLSRSWNRFILMAGMEKDERFVLTGRLWNRITDGDNVDDNPNIEDYVGRAELSGTWNVNKDNSLVLTMRNSLSAPANGSYRLEWFSRLGDAGRGGRDSGLRFYTQLFTGYGDSLVDYNHWRTVLGVGLSLVDW